MKNHYYSQHAGPLRAELGAAISREQMRDLHRKQPARHLLVAARQFAILVVATWGLIRFENPLIWVPLVVVQGFTVFNFTVLLHEVVHHTIFDRRRPALERFLGFLYAVPSGISSSQFTRWHLDHHAELGSDEDDPKRHHLSPKINARWYKLLYCTPGALPDLLPRRAPRVGDVSRAAAARDRPRTARLVAVPPLGDGPHLVRLRVLRRAAGEHHPGVLHLPDRVHAEPARAALRHRSGRSREVGHADARQLVLGLRVPELELSPRAPLLPGRAVLPPAGGAAAAGAVLREEADALAHLQRARLRVAGAEPGAAHELGRRARLRRGFGGAALGLGAPKRRSREGGSLT